jgi:hypothetical protein
VPWAELQQPLLKKRQKHPAQVLWVELQQPLLKKRQKHPAQVL